MVETIHQKQNSRNNLPKTFWRKQSTKNIMAETIYQKQNGRNNLPKAKLKQFKTHLTKNTLRVLILTDDY